MKPFKNPIYFFILLITLINFMATPAYSEDERLTKEQVKQILGSSRDLSGRNLSKMNLSGLDLSNVNLRGANLNKAKLKRQN